MPRTCTICGHSRRLEIDQALVSGESFRNIAERFAVSVGALSRHKDAHVTAALVQAKAAQDEADAIDVMTELRRCFDRVNLLFDACDRWLRDADDPTRYDIGPRAEELDVTYDELVIGKDGKQRMVRRKKKLSALLPAIQSETLTVALIETRYADPRDLVLKTANRLQGQLELLSKLMGDLEDGNVFNVVVSADWVQIRTGLLSALAPYPEARQAVATTLQVIEGGRSHGAA